MSYNFEIESTSYDKYTLRNKTGRNIRKNSLLTQQPLRYYSRISARSFLCVCMDQLRGPHRIDNAAAQNDQELNRVVS